MCGGATAAAAAAAMPRAASRDRASSAQSGLVGPAAPVSVAQFDFDRAHPTLAFKHYDRSKDEESYRAFLVRVCVCVCVCGCRAAACVSGCRVAACV